MSADEAAQEDFHRRWRTLRPPLRPGPEVIAAVEPLLPSGDGALLLLGVTPELAAIPRNMIAVDWSERMIAVAWPGDNERRRVVRGDWRHMPLPDDVAVAAISDGAISILDFPGEMMILLDQLRRVLVPGGRAVIRCFATPEPGETLAEVREAALAGGLAFHAFKQRFTMAAAHDAGVDNIACTTLHAAFEALFPDRAALARANGWSLDTIAEIDAYRVSPYVHCYPGRSRLLAALPGWLREARFVETTGYPLAERCPLLVLDFP